MPRRGRKVKNWGRISRAHFHRAWPGGFYNHQGEVVGEIAAIEEVFRVLFGGLPQLIGVPGFTQFQRFFFLAGG